MFLFFKVSAKKHPQHRERKRHYLKVWSRKKEKKERKEKKSYPRLSPGEGIILKFVYVVTRIIGLCVCVAYIITSIHLQHAISPTNKVTAL